MITLITAADVFEHTNASANADATILNKAVDDATTSYLRPLTGPALLAQLLAFVASAPTPPALLGLSASAKQTALGTYAADLAAWRTAQAGDPLLVLWDKLKSCLAQWTLYEAWPDLLVHIDAAGVVQKVGGGQSGATTADVATVNQVHTAHRDKAVRRGTELVSWLEAHKTDYPAYQSTRPLATNRHPIDYVGGISL